MAIRAALVIFSMGMPNFSAVLAIRRRILGGTW